MSERRTKRRATLADVAARAGVSSATASRALADDPRITGATRASVLDAAEALEYVPNLAARSLRARKTRALGLLLADLSDPVHGQVAAGFELEASRDGYSVIIVAANDVPAEERAGLTVFVERSTDGICVASASLDPTEIRDRVGSGPLTLIQPDHDGLLADDRPLPPGTIRADDLEGIRLAVRHLLALGHRDIAYLGSGDRATNRLRRGTVETTLTAEAGVAGRAFQVADDAWTRPRAVASLVVGDLPEAIVCYDDKLALSLIDGLRSEGISVPGDVSVVGFDGIPFAALSNPRLTTVVTPSVEVGRLAARTLVDAVTTGHLAPPRLLPVELLVRESSGPPRARGRSTGSATAGRSRVAEHG